MSGRVGWTLTAGRERWWLEVTGKDSKARQVPATSEVMIELIRYRKAASLRLLSLEGRPCRS